MVRVKTQITITAVPTYYYSHVSQVVLILFIYKFIYFIRNIFGINDHRLSKILFLHMFFSYQRINVIMIMMYREYTPYNYKMKIYARFEYASTSIYLYSIERVGLHVYRYKRLFEILNIIYYL